VTPAESLMSDVLPVTLDSLGLHPIAGGHAAAKPRAPMLRT